MRARCRRAARKRLSRLCPAPHGAAPQTDCEIHEIEFRDVTSARINAPGISAVPTGRSLATSSNLPSTSGTKAHRDCSKRQRNRRLFRLENHRPRAALRQMQVQQEAIVDWNSMILFTPLAPMTANINRPEAVLRSKLSRRRMNETPHALSFVCGHLGRQSRRQCNVLVFAKEHEFTCGPVPKLVATGAKGRNQVFAIPGIRKSMPFRPVLHPFTLHPHA